MADEAPKKDHPPGMAYKTLMATIGTGLLVFFANLIWNSFESNGRSIEEIQRKLEKVSADQARWGLLTDLHNQMITLDQRQVLYENDVKWLKWTLEHRVTAVVEPKKPDGPTPGVPAPLPAPMPVPRPRAGNALDEGQKPFAPEDLRKLYEQKQKQQYPVPSEPQKK